MLKSKRGFTLVELLAVIVILAIILAIAVPVVTAVTTKAKTDSFTATVKMIVKGAEYTYVKALQAGTAATYSTVASDYGTSEVSIESVTRDANTGVISVSIYGNAGGKFNNCGTVTAGGTAATASPTPGNAVVTAC